VNKKNQPYDRAVHNCENIRLRVEWQLSREGMWLGQRTPRVDSLNLAKLHKYTGKLSFFIMWLLYMYNYWGDRINTGLCEPL